MRKLVSILMAVVLLVTSSTVALAASSGFENFTVIKEYSDTTFTDVSPTDWYASSVKIGYEYGLIYGTSETTFSPTGNITVAQSIAFACRMHNIYYAQAYTFESSAPWYQSYVDYAVANGIIEQGEYGNYSAVATRAQFAKILSKAIPESALEPINEISTIPDVSMSDSYGPAVYLLYRAGILAGNNEYGVYAPTTNITRVAVSAILARMASPEARLKTTLKVAVTGISLSNTSLSVIKGKTAALSATIMPDNATDQNITWTTSNSAVATVNNGTVTGVSIGTTVITAAVGEKTASCTVTVTEEPTLTTSNLSITLKVPTVGGLNWYAELLVKNNSASSITMPIYIGINGYTLCGNGEVVPSGTTVKLSYYNTTWLLKKRVDRDMYFDNNSTGYAVMDWNGSQYYAEYGVNGITTFYKGNVNGPKN